MPLAENFLLEFAKKYRLSKQSFSDEAISALKSYQWPGNIRELSHMIERAIFLSQEQIINLADLGWQQNEKDKGVSGFDFSHASLDDIEKHVIVERLSRFDNNGHEAAASLGLSRSSYYRRLEKHNL